MPRLSDLKVKLFTDGAEKAKILKWPGSRGSPVSPQTRPC
jgi:hypothetical protein